MKNQSQRRPSVSGFTLIELLVVIAIIAILAGLLIPITGAVNKAKIQSRARAQISQLSTAIDRYQQKKGFYPPDQPGKPSINLLFYELWGVMPDGADFVNDFGQGVRLSPASVAAFFAPTPVSVVNSSPEKKEVDNFIPDFKADKVKNINTANAPLYVFYSPSKGPNDINDVNGSKVNLINYVLTNPKHNANTYDLWIDVIIGSKTNRISNWSNEPEKNVGPY